ncbi:MAG: hypothetical protein ACTSRA_21550, partial [Promethearchaeota archaeon]
MNAPTIGKDDMKLVIRGFLKNKFWPIGMLLNVLSIPYSTFVLSISSLLILTIFQRSGIIITVVFAIFHLKEKLSWTEIFGLILLYVGFFTMVIGVQIRPTIDFTNDVISLIFFLVTVCATFIIYFYFRKNKKFKVREFILAACAGILGAGGTISLKLVPLVVGRDLNNVNYIFNIFNFKDLGWLIISVFIPNSNYFFGSIYFYLWIVCFCGNFLFQQMMFQSGRASITIPVASN